MIWNLIKNKPPQKKSVILRMEYPDQGIKYEVAFWRRKTDGEVEWILSCVKYMSIGDTITITHWADPLDITFPKKGSKKVVNRFELMEL